MMYSIDEVLLERMQKFCDFMQETVGITKFKVAKCLFSFGFGVLFFALMCDAINEPMIFVPLVVAFGAIFGRRLARILGTFDEDESFFLKHNQLKRPSPFHQARDRMCFTTLNGLLCVLLLFISAMLNDLQAALIAHALILEIIFAYADACIPRPPGRSKLRKAVERLRTWLNRKLVPA